MARSFKLAGFIAQTVLAGFLGVLAGPALADTPIRIRGTVVSVEGSVLTVKSCAGETIVVHLANGWTANGVVKATMADMKPGMFVGTTAAPADDGTVRAIEVHIFPEALRGRNEGVQPWDLGPQTSMTNATIEADVAAASGRSLTLNYKGGKANIVVTPQTAIIAYAPASTADLKAGAAVFVPAQRKDDGTFEASRVSVGLDGVVPPM